MKRKVLIACKLEEAGLKKLRARQDFELEILPKPSEAELKSQLRDAEAVIIKSNVKLTADALEEAKALKIICRAGAGVDNVDLKKATLMGIPVTNTPGLNSNSVAEQVFSYIHILYKNLAAYDRTTKAGQWEKGRFPINELRGKTLGICGLGAIGRRVLEKARGYRMNVLAFDPFLSKTLAEDLGIMLVSDIKELFRKSDVVTLHMPATPETKGFVTCELLCSMKKNAVFVNTARGSLLAPNALEQAMEKHETLCAGTDVFADENPGEKILANFGDRVVMTPHVAGNSVEAQLEIAELAADMVIAALCENKLMNLVNFVKIPDELNVTYMDLAESLAAVSAGFLRGKGQVEEVRITCYGKLHPFNEILIKPAIKGVLSYFMKEGVTLINAEAIAKEQGIKIMLREPDQSKGYSESITVDVMVRSRQKAEEVSVRGKLIEGEPVIVRIDEFHEMGIKPQGSQLFFIYDDRPGVIGAIATLLGKDSINIESILARVDTGKKRQLLAIKVGQMVSPALLKKIEQSVETKIGIKVSLARNIRFGE